jgi:sigma-B regulation protein RsbU (phosphoserine phosphatase)
MILGVLPTAIPYEEGVVPLRPGDVLVLFTDGVSEAMDAHGVDYGEDRLERLLCSNREKSPAGLIAAISEDIRRHAGAAAQSDDITMMVLKVGAA